MQIVFKVREGCLEAARKTVEDDVAGLLPPLARRELTLRPMFPGVTSGRRRGMCVLELPDDLPAERLERVLSTLRSDEAIEYAELPARKGPV